MGLAQGSVMAKTGISSVPLTLGGYLALLGVSYLLADGGTLSYENYSVGTSLDTQIATVFSPRSLIVLGVFMAVGLVFALTRIGPEGQSGGRGPSCKQRRWSADRLDPCWDLHGVGLLFGSRRSGFSPIAPLPPRPTSDCPRSSSRSPPRFWVGWPLRAVGEPRAGILLGVLTLSLLETLFAQLGTPAYAVDLVRGGPLGCCRAG